jgi:hypothetical protein
MADDEVRVVIHVSPALRDKLKELGRKDGRVLMRQIEHVLKEYVAKAE